MDNSRIYQKCPSPPYSDTTDGNKAGSFTTGSDIWANQDTIHYLSPATTARTVCEGDFDYWRFLQYYPKIDITDVRSESTISCEEMRLQRTLAMVKPEAMVYKDVVLKVIVDAGFDIVNERVVHLTAEQVAELYEQYYGCPFFPNMVVSTSVGPILVLSLAAINAVEKWKSIVGPYKTLKEEWFLPLQVRKRFGLHVDMPETLHASENIKDATRENRFFYPRSTLEPIIADEERVKDYCELNVNQTLVKGLVELCRVKPVDPVLFLAEWLLLNNPYQPQMPYGVLVAPT